MFILLFIGEEKVNKTDTNINGEKEDLNGYIVADSDICGG